MAELDDLLKFDPLAVAEKLTGGSIHGPDSDVTIALGWGLAQRHAEAKNEVLTELSDTMLCNDLARYTMIIEKFGFEKVLEESFSKRGKAEYFFIYAHRKGLLLCFDTFSATRVNGGHVYYNWKPLVPYDEAWSVTSTGGYYDGKDGLVWAGNHDCREALIHKLNKLNNRGEFVSPWEKQPFLWLLHHGDKSDNYADINEARILRLPHWVRDFISTEADGNT